MQVTSPSSPQIPSPARMRVADQGTLSSGLLMLLISAAVAVTTACGGSSNPPAATVSVLSSRPDLVTDGTALVSVEVPAGVTAANVKLSAGSADVTGSLKPAGQGKLVGLVTGIPTGQSQLVVSGDAAAALTVRNTDRNGPKFSGPHQSPWLCQTDTFPLPDGTTLGPPRDENCNAPAKVLYLYKAQGGTGFKPLPSTAPIPADMSTTVTSDGRTVNYIVRLETGTLNRGIYQFAVLYDPTKEAAPDPLGSYQAWNKKLVYYFGGGMGAGYRQGNSNILVLVDFMLSRGFAVISSTLNGPATNPSDVLSAETVSMVKEQFIKTFGVPRFTMGWGASGGSMEQHLIATNYPGLLDGLVPSQTFPDLLSVVPNAMDCPLLDRAFNSSSQTWSDAQKAAVDGWYSHGTCNSPTVLSWNRLYAPFVIQAKRSNNAPFLGIDFNNCPSAIPAGWTYDPVTNRSGARCDLYSSIQNLLGIDSSTGFAARPLDNVGVQYGFKAYQAGTISAEQFVQLNELIGGYDNDGNFQAQRTAGNELAVTRMYEYGRVVSGANLANVPIIDFRSYVDQNPDVHNSIHGMSFRARLVRTNGNADNHVMLRSIGTALDPDVLARMDEWLTAITNDTRSYPTTAAKVVANKPSGLSDACYANGERIVEPADINNGGRCGQLMPFYSTPRMASGAPLTDDVLKCQMKPLVRADYPNLSDSQFARLGAVFPGGVCNYALPGVGSNPLKGSWLSYSAPGIAAPLN